MLLMGPLLPPLAPILEAILVEAKLVEERGRSHHSHHRRRRQRGRSQGHLDQIALEEE